MNRKKRCVAYLDARGALDVVEADLEEVSHLEGRLLPQHPLLHHPVGVVDDGQKHIQQDKEDKKDIAHEVEWTEGTVRLLYLSQVEVAKHGAEHGVG